MQELSDEQLDAYVMARLRALGVDLSVLPEEDEDAPADRAGILRSARRFLRETLPVIADFRIDPQEVPPILYPAEHAGRSGAGPSGAARGDAGGAGPRGRDAAAGPGGGDRTRAGGSAEEG